jgi:release factor glutamine methyltransferase
VTLAEHAADAARTLAAAGLASDDSRQDAALLARWALGWSQAEWLARQREAAAGTFADAYQSAIRRRANREPIAYITGTREFYGRAFRVTPDVLIPRPESELVVEEALALLAAIVPTPGPAAPRVADVGAGSGCLAVTLALERPNAHILAIDVSEAALRIAYENARTLGAGSRIEFWRGAFLPRGVPPLDLVVANPPYVAERDRDQLPIEVRGFEPAQALFGGPDGLRVIRALVPEAATALRSGGWLVMEIGAGQADAVAALLKETGNFTLHHVRRDLQGIPRVVVARRI